MNGITLLKIDRESAKRWAQVYHEGISELRSYLCSDKFHLDTTVQVSDVLHRLSEVESSADRAVDEYESAAYQAARKADDDRRRQERRNCEKCGKFGKGWEVVDSNEFGVDTILCRKCREMDRKRR